MIARDQTHQVLAYHSVFRLVDTIDAGGVHAYTGVDGAPARDAVGADERVDGGREVGDVEGGAAWGWDGV